MLRNFIGLLSFVCLVIFGLVVSVGAGDDSVVISQIKTGESGFASHEYVSIFNNSDSGIDVTDWCLEYASSTNKTSKKLNCLKPPADNVHLKLEPKEYARFSTQEFKNAISEFEPDGVFSSGISGTSGHLRILDSASNEVDRVGWGEAINPEGSTILAHSSGNILQRLATENGLSFKDTDNNSQDFEEVILEDIPSSGIFEHEEVIDICLNIDGPQMVLPEGFALNEDGLCVKEIAPLESSILEITELLPNSDSYDTGNEFIEIYNPNADFINLENYKLQLGPDFNKTYIFPSQIIEPFSYLVITDSDSDLVLPNSSASLRLIAPSGDIVSQTDQYAEPPEEQSWALINNIWQYSSMLTPGKDNLPSPVALATTLESQKYEDCGPGKFRNPETNRCKSITSSTNSLKPCSPGQIRNPETNRCKSVASANSLVPCKLGQERNPATNRCRSTSGSSSELKPCKEGQERNPETNRCRKTQNLNGGVLSNVEDVPPSASSGSLNMTGILAILLAVGGYAAYEWRVEILRYLSKLNPRFKLAR